MKFNIDFAEYIAVIEFEDFLGEAINNDWRKTGDWQQGWEYIIK